jgi:uncharacterized sulfatase
MRKTRDLGLIPEPILEELALKSDSREEILNCSENKKLLDEIFEVIEVGQERRHTLGLIEKMHHKQASVRWWAARQLGNLTKDAETVEVLTSAMSDGSTGVRVEAARSLCIIGRKDKALPVLLKELKNENQVVRHYAALALEDTCPGTRAVYDAMKEVQQDEYEYVKRVSTRYVKNWKPD